jgi:PAS domain-containing protein
MFPKEIEMILSRHLASCLAMPIFIVDPSGALVFFNESAEPILGRRFADCGELPVHEWASAFTPVEQEGASSSPAGRPLADALLNRRPAQVGVWINGPDGERRHIEITTFPIIGQVDRHLGAVAVIWESGK